MIRAKEQQFSKYNGPASQKIYKYMCEEWPSLLKDIDPFRSHMFTLSLAQEELGYLEADRLFFRASLEAIRSKPWEFSKVTFLRVLGQLGLYYTPGLYYKEFFYETPSGHMWGFQEQRMIENKSYFNEWRNVLSKMESPLEWERRAIKIRLLRAIGFKYKMPELPETFRMMRIVELEPSGEIKWLYCGDSNMTERLWYCRDLDVYFYLGYWGQKDWSRGALKILKYWDMILMPKGTFRVNIHRVMWILWVVGMFLVRPRWRSMSLSALFSIAILYAFCHAIFTDNFGGRHELYMIIFLWTGGFCGMLGILKKLRIKYVKNKDITYNEK
jgi:hypothetical protein